MVHTIRSLFRTRNPQPPPNPHPPVADYSHLRRTHAIFLPCGYNFAAFARIEPVARCLPCGSQRRSVVRAGTSGEVGHGEIDTSSTFGRHCCLLVRLSDGRRGSAAGPEAGPPAAGSPGSGCPGLRRADPAFGAARCLATCGSAPSRAASNGATCVGAATARTAPRRADSALRGAEVSRQTGNPCAHR